MDISNISITESSVATLEEFAARLKRYVEQHGSWESPSGFGDQVSGVRVVGPSGEIKKEWHK